MPIFDITRPKDIIRLSVDRKGEIPFVVTNVSGSPIKARLEVMPLAPADRDIFTIEGGTERNMRDKDTLNVKVMVAAPPTTAPGSHKFYLKVVDVDFPDDRFGESQSVEFQVPETKPPKPPLPRALWLIPIGILLIIAGGGTYWYLYNHPKLENYKGKKVDDAVFDLRKKGMKPAVFNSTIVLNADEDGLVVRQTIDGKPIEGQRVKRGTEVTLEAQVKMPNLIGHNLAAAKSELAKMGFTEVNVITAQSQDQWDTVFAQEPDPGPPPKPYNGIIQLSVKVKPDPVPGGMPNLVGQDYCDSRRQLGELGLAASEGLLNFSNTQPGMNNIVRGQTPNAGTPLLKGATGVSLTHSGGPIRCIRHHRITENAFPFAIDNK